MRDLLFRAKRTDNDELIEGNDEWIEGSYVHLNLGRHYIFTGKLDLTQHNYKGRIGFECFEVNPETVGQYTDVNDSNGTKIFEGDIVDILTENEERGVITYENGGFVVKASTFVVDFMSNINGEDVEVLGNIVDNPELLEEE